MNGNTQIKNNFKVNKKLAVCYVVVFKLYTVVSIG